MRIFVTGNLGYIGAWLCQHFRKQYPDAFLAGYDQGYFQHCLTTASYSPERCLDVQYYGDVRDLREELLQGFDHVVHLAAISNDPIGNRFEQVTFDVNFRATVEIARKAKGNGIQSFVFASSCSVYGAGGDEAKSENAVLNPLTAYARSKVLAEEGLRELAGDGMKITCLRFATACGMTDRLRLDLVLNDFVASAVTRRRIDIQSDGTPWRPLIDVRDMARAIDWSINRPLAQGGNFLVCNTGTNEWNYTVKQLAECVQENFDNVEVTVNAMAPRDKRSYRVNFDLFNSYAGSYSPRCDVRRTISEIREGLNSLNFRDDNFRNSRFVRLNALNTFIRLGSLDENLRWIESASSMLARQPEGELVSI